jgi:hypothetical protein
LVKTTAPFLCICLLKVVVIVKVSWKGESGNLFLNYCAVFSGN